MNHKPIYAKMPETPKYEIVNPGNYVARCFSMVQLGTHKGEYKGKETLKEKVRITWELPTELREDGKPFVIGEEYTLSMHEMGNLRPMLSSWRGRAFTDEEAQCFDITKILEVPCLINIIHTASKDGKRTYANISSISPLIKGMACPPQVNPSMVFTLDDFGGPMMDQLPEFVQNKIKESEEYKAMVETPTYEPANPSNVPLPTVQEAQAHFPQETQEIRVEDVPF